MANISLDTVQNQSLLEAWNAELSRSLAPDSGILVLYLILGVTGNFLVIYIHTCRLAGNKDDRYFIPALAVMDMMSCVLNVGFSVSINTLPVMYTNAAACKTMWFLCMTATVSSTLMLLLIAVQRYQKICKPFGKQMTLFWKRTSISLIILFALLLSWPCFLFYGPKEVKNEEYKIVGLRCTSITGTQSKTAALVFKGILFLITATVLISLITLYSLIGRVIYHQIRYRKLKHYASTTESGTTDTSPSRVGSSVSGKDTCHTKEASITSQQMSEIPKISNGEKMPQFNAASNEKTGEKVRPTNAIPGVRLSLIFMLISVVFIISYIPKVIMMVYESQKENFWTELTHAEMGGYRFLYTAFIINNIVNPLIYGFFDRRFRQEARAILCCCVRKRKI